MSTAKQKLAKDLRIIEMMISKVNSYLDGEALFWPLIQMEPPIIITLGGYLMRHNRLLALRRALNSGEQNRLDIVTARFDRILLYRSPEFQHKAHQELEARLQQWDKYLGRLNDPSCNDSIYYDSAVETRVMIEDILQHLHILPGNIASHIFEGIEQLDLKLSQYWQPGRFVWSAPWQPAYPEAIYWWLYGRIGTGISLSPVKISSLYQAVGIS